MSHTDNNNNNNNANSDTKEIKIELVRADEIDSRLNPSNDLYRQLSFSSRLAAARSAVSEFHSAMHNGLMEILFCLRMGEELEAVEADSLVELRRKQAEAVTRFTKHWNETEAAHHAVVLRALSAMASNKHILNDHEEPHFIMRDGELVNGVWLGALTARVAQGIAKHIAHVAGLTKDGPQNDPEVGRVADILRKADKDTELMLSSVFPETARLLMTKPIVMPANGDNVAATFGSTLTDDRPN